ncbi:MAG: acetate--CoA ligase family protein [Acidimicrobiia bacterium]
MTIQNPVAPPSLDPMLRATSVVVVGASERPGSVGDQTMRQLLSGGFDGKVLPVNPRYRTIHGLASLPTLSSIEEEVDLVVLAIANGRLEEEMLGAAALGARSVVIFASCHGLAADGTPLRARIREIAEDAGIAICGGNGMGFLNIERGLRICGFYQPPELEPGGVTFLTHSGSLFSAMLHNRRDLRFNLVVSTGLEINTTMDRYMDWALGLESTKVVALFLETIRSPGGFVDALRAAAARDVPVVALKVGSSPRGQDAVATHSEGLAGDDAVYEALFDAHGVHRVLSMDEMMDTIEIFVAGRRATAPGLGAVHDSGGERALLIDASHRFGVPLPSLGREATARLEEILDPGLEAENPVDAWGTGRDAEGVFVEALGAVAGDPSVGAVVFAVDLTTEETQDDAYSNAVLTVSRQTDKPVAVLANVTTTVDPAQAASIRAAGIPVLEGTDTALRAIRHLLDHERHHRLPALEARVTEPWDPGRGIDSATAALDVVASYGIPTPRSGVANDLTEARLLGRDIGYPLVAKTAEGIDHKSDSGGVILGIRRETDLLDAYRELSVRFGPAVVIAEEVPPGVELALGMILDAQFGPVFLISTGGTLIEVIHERIALLPPIDRSRAIDVIDRMKARPLLDGARGRPPADLGQLADTMVRFSELAVDAGPVLSAIDVNPIIVGGERTVAVDALFKGLR